MQISKEMKDRIIDVFIKNNKKFYKTLYEVAPNGEISVEQLYRIIEEYKEKDSQLFTGKKIAYLSSKIPDEELYQLKEKGYNYKDIYEYLNKKGIKISYADTRELCQNAYYKMPKGEYIKIKISDEEIFELREQGYTYGEIVKYYKQKGIEVSDTTISTRCKRIYKEKGKERPNVIRKRISDEEIFKLREQGLTYKNIVKYFEQKGVKVSSKTISTRCKRIYREKGKEEPIVPRLKITNEMIYELREQKLTYKEIAEYLMERGINVSESAISVRCKKIYEEKGIKPKPINRVKVSEEEVYELREKGYTYKEILRYFNRKGIKVTYQTILVRGQNIYKEKGKKKPVIYKSKVPDEEVYNLREQGLTYREIVEHLKNKGIKISIKTVAERCKKIYDAKGKENPVEVKSKILDEEILKSREQGLTYREIFEKMQEKGIKTSINNIAVRCRKLYKELEKENPSIPRVKISEEQVCTLREQGWSYREITEYFGKQGIKVSGTTIENICKKWNVQKGKAQLVERRKERKPKSDRTTDKDKIKSAILSLRESKNASDEQLETMAKLYGVDLDLEEEKEI